MMNRRAGAWRWILTPLAIRQRQFTWLSEPARLTLMAAEQEQDTPKSKIAAGLLAIFLGWLGIHKFYLGYTGPGIILSIALWHDRMVIFLHSANSRLDNRTD